METKTAVIPLPGDERISGILNIPDGYSRDTGIIMAHGAGNDMNHPMLFFADTRDPLRDLELLQGVLSRLASPWDLEIIEGGDHSFAVPKSHGTDQTTIYELILGKMVAWLKG